jgi:glycerol-3-phosphate cytidylyltransferase-like family protein
MRTPYKMYCQQCGIVFVTTKDKNKRKYCSTACFHTSTRKRIKIKCHYCNEDIEKTPDRINRSKHKVYFCNIVRKNKAQSLNSGELGEKIRPRHYGNGLGNYRHRALRFYGHKCNKCNYSKDIRMLEVDHVDNNRKNHDIANLEVLYVWCHYLKTRKVPYHTQQEGITNSER